MIKNEYNFRISHEGYKKVIEFLKQKHEITQVKISEQSLHYHDTPALLLASDGVVLYTQRQPNSRTEQRFEALNMYSDAPQRFTYSISHVPPNQKVNLRELNEIYPNLGNEGKNIRHLFSAEISSVKQHLLVEDHNELRPAMLEVSFNAANFIPTDNSMIAGDKMVYKWMALKRVSGSNGQKDSVDILQRTVSEITRKFNIQPETQTSLSNEGFKRYVNQKNCTKENCNIALNIA